MSFVQYSCLCLDFKQILHKTESSLDVITEDSDLLNWPPVIFFIIPAVDPKRYRRN